MGKSAAVQFPWLPGEGARLPNPAFIYRDDARPPRHLMLTLELLAQRADADGQAPSDWLAEIEADALNAPIRAFARERFGLLDVWNAERSCYDWFEANAVAPDGTAAPVARQAALERCWRGYAGLLLTELDAAQETPAAAMARIKAEWEQWKQARAAEFIATWRNAAAWPPVLALSWIMFAGDWERVAVYLQNGRDMPSALGLLRCADSLFADGEEMTPRPNPNAYDDLMRAMCARTNRVAVRGRLNAAGAMVEIDPMDLASLQWADNPNNSFGAVLERYGGESYSNVMVDAASVMRVFPGTGQAPPFTGLHDLIREAAAGVTPGMRAAQRNDAIRAALRAKGLTEPSDSTIKEALKGTPHLKQRSHRA